MEEHPLVADELTVVLEQVVSVLQRKATRRLLFITGAGASAESGLPTYRGVGGLYNETETDEAIPIETILSSEMLATRPELTWKYLHQMESFSRGKRPNRVHESLARFDEDFEVVVLTQNIDGFHNQAGSKHVIELHGDIHRLRCTRGSCDWNARVTDFTHLAPLPRCERCGAMIRPDVVLFGEALPVDALAALQDYTETPFASVFSIGTTSVFPYIQAPVLKARSEGGLTIEINPIETLLSKFVDYRVRTAAGIFLNQLWERYLATQNLD